MTYTSRLVPPTRFILLAAAACLPLLLAGCEREDIAVYHVPKAKAMLPASAKAAPVTAAASLEGKPTRILGAIIPKPPRVWFIKLMGPDATVAAARESFEKFIASIRFTGGAPGEPPITWTKPDSWTEQPSAPGMRFATFTLGEGANAAELTIIPLGVEAADVLANVNRWRGQVGLTNISPDDLAKEAKAVNVDGQQATIVEMVGIGSAASTGNMAGGAGGMGGPMMGGLSKAPPAPPAAPPMPKFTVPAGWKQDEKPTAFAVASFTAGEGDEAVKTSMSPMRGAAGGVVANVNRWRGQAGLTPVDEDGIRAIAKPARIDNHDAIRFDIAGEKLRIVVTMFPHDESMWFFRMSGPPAAVEKQFAAYESFIASLKFDGGHHD